MDSIKIVGAFDTNDPQVTHIADAIIAEEKKDIVLDMSEVSYLATQGMACVIKVLKRLQAVEGVLHVYGATQDVRDLFHMVKIDQYLHFL